MSGRRDRGLGRAVVPIAGRALVALAAALVVAVIVDWGNLGPTVVYGLAICCPSCVSQAPSGPNGGGAARVSTATPITTTASYGN